MLFLHFRHFPILTSFCYLGTEEYRDSVIKIRKQCQRVSKERLVFIDGSGLRSEPRPLTWLAPSGETPKTTAEKAEKYEPRVDIMGAISYYAPLAVETKRPSRGEQPQILEKEKSESKVIQRIWLKIFLKTN